MPLYEYECLTNKHRFEVIQKFDDPPVTQCTVCGEPVQKLLSSPAIQFKGTGWYITDYARKGATSEKPADKGTSEKSEAQKEEPTKKSSTETKPAKKPSETKES